MRGATAKRLRREAQGGGKDYRRHLNTGQVTLTPSCWRANYQQLKKQLKAGSLRVQQP
jgi:hypothetical protein